MTADQRQPALDQVRDLEAQFADTISRLYAVGNGLAEVRHTLESQAAAASAVSAPAPTSAPEATPAS
ncbi:MAG: hypothetical protein Q4G67_15645, partial [Actinomycetia bacterium]|nr:hypothetical protein [Actinomycetes bacterium]